MSYQDQVSQMKDAGFSGNEIQDWSDNQAVKLRQAGFNQDEVNSYQGMQPPAPGTPPVYGRLPTDKDFSNAASVILGGDDHPFYGNAVDSLKNLFSDTGVHPAEAVKATQDIPSFHQIMENGGSAPTWGDYGTEFLHGVGSTVASGMQGLAVEGSHPNNITATYADPESLPLYQKGAAFQKWIDERLPVNQRAEKDSPIKTGIVSGIGSLIPMVATGGVGMAATGAQGGYEQAKQEGADTKKSIDYAGKMGAVWGVLGVADVGMFLKPVERSAPGFLPWLTAKATQAVRGGLTFAGTNEFGDWLSSEIGKASDIPIQYKPTLQRIVINAATGGLAGLVGRTSVRPGPRGAQGEPTPPGGGNGPSEPPPPGAASAGALKPAYHFDTDTYGLQNAKGEFVQTGFHSEEDAAKAAVQQPIAAAGAPVDPEEINKYKQKINEDAQNSGLNITPEQLNNAAKKMAESHVAEKEELQQPVYGNVPRKPLGLADFVRKNGGINDEGGDVATMLGGAKYRPGLINSNGKSLDDMALAAHEAGFFPDKGEEERPSINEFKDKLNEDLHGNHQHSVHDFEAAQEYKDSLAHNAEVDRASTETGIDTKGKTHAQFWDEVSQHLSPIGTQAKINELAERAEHGSESWRTEALEPEEHEAMELENARKQKQASENKPIGTTGSGEPGLAPGTEKPGETVLGRIGGGPELAGSTNEGNVNFRQQPTSTPILPKSLAGAKPRYSFGAKKFTLSFDNDIDKALFITSQKTPSKRDLDYRNFLEENGYTDRDIETGGRQIREQIKQQAKEHPEFNDTDKLSNINVGKEAPDNVAFQKGAQLSPEANELLKPVFDFIKRVAPQASSEVREDAINTPDGGIAHGSYDRLKDMITISLTAPDKLLTAAHESLHAIKDAITASEWRTLLNEAEKQNLSEKYNINERYNTPDDPHLRQEETIAHWFADWAKDNAAEASPKAKNIFQKIMDVFKELGDKIRQTFGNTSAEDIFRKIESGEIGQRAAGEKGEGTLFQKDDEKKPTIGDAARAIRDTLSPTSAGDKAKSTEIAIRGGYGEAKRQQAIAESALNEFGRQGAEIIKDPKQLNDFYNHVEGRSRGVELKNKQFQKMADAVRDIYARYKDYIQAMPETRMMNFVTDYFTHQWAPGQEQKIQDFMNTWWQQGSGRNLKERKIPTIADGLAYGLKLEEPNPVRAVSRYVGSMSNYLASVKVLRAINTDLGGGYYADGKQPDGYVPLVGRNAERIENARIDPESGKLVPARTLKLYAPQQVADLYNAFYSKGFEDTKLKSTYMLARDAINANTLLELGLSAYHFSTITMQSLNQDMGRMLRNAWAGDWSGVGQALRGLVTPALHFTEGSKLLEQYKDLADHGIDMERIADLFARSNLRIGIDPLSNISTHGGFYKAWQRGELPVLIERLKSQMTEGHGIGALKSGAEAIGRLVSDVAHPLFNVYIPAIKMSAFHDLMGDWLRQNTGASDTEISRNALRIGDMVEDRFGEMNMENIFWNKKAKELLGLTLRAPGWDIGLVRQVGGAGYDVYRMIKDGIQRKGFDPNRLDRPLFVAGALIVYAATNSLMTYLKTGKAPDDQKLKDFIAYATGGLHRAFGMNPERGELPGHGRELLQLAPNPGEGPLSGVTQEIGNKVATLPKKIYQAATNTDWNGKPIYDPKSNSWIKRTPGVAQAAHIASGFEPFSMQQIFAGKPEGSNLSFAERFMGVRSAGAKIVNPEGLKEYKEQHR